MRESYDRYLVLVCDADTGEWSIIHQSEKPLPAANAAQEKRNSGDSSPMIVLCTSDFIPFG